MTDLESLEAARSRVAALAAMLGPDEVRVLELVAEGLACGRSVYGELRVSTDRRNFTDEATAELRDTLVYVGAQLVRILRVTRGQSVGGVGNVLPGAER